MCGAQSTGLAHSRLSTNGGPLPAPCLPLSVPQIRKASLCPYLPKTPTIIIPTKILPSPQDFPAQSFPDIARKLPPLSLPFLPPSLMSPTLQTTNT